MLRPDAPRDVRPSRRRPWLIALLAVAVVLRLALAGNGGQFFFGDESRHQRGVALYQAVRTGDAAGLRAALARPEHIGFTLLGAGITGLQHLGAQCTRWGDWQRPEHIDFTYPIGAGWLSLFSSLNIWLVYRISRRAGATTTEAGWAALLMACSNSGFYYARHFLPYDAAISCALFSIWTGLDGKRSVACGLLAGATYHLYNGYWYLVPILLGLHAVGLQKPLELSARRIVGASVGAALAVSLPVVAGLALAGRDYWDTMVAFSGTVNQGLYREGWSLPWEYFWHSEGIAGVLVCLGIAGALLTAERHPVNGVDRRAWLWLGAAAGSYGLLVLFSVGLGKFVVYARTIKPLVPLLCLAGGWAAARLLARRVLVARLAAGAFGVAAILHFIPHLLRVFPTEVELSVLRSVGNPKHTLSITGSLYAPLSLPVQRPDLALVNAQMLYPVRNYLGYPAGNTLLRIEHPLTYLPYQYESHNPRERALLRSNDISIRLIRLAEPGSVPDDLPLPQRFSSQDRPDGRRD